MRKIYILLLFFYLNLVFPQQNLVLNPSFEDAIAPLDCTLPPASPATFPFEFWTPVSTPDPFSLNYQTFCQTYALSIFSNKMPRTGNNYVGFSNVYHINNDYREFITGELASSLLVGYKYDVSFYISLAAVSNSGMNNIGMKFFNARPDPNNVSNIFPSVPDVNYNGIPILENINWHLLSFQFTPTQIDQKFFTIGNFYSRDDTDFQFLSSFSPSVNSTPISYILVDDVDVHIVLPLFEIVDEICQDEIVDLPNNSLNGYVGTWTPAFNNQETTTYTFTPENASVGLIQKTILVRTKEAPVFEVFGPFCENTDFELPTISQNGIEGTWQPIFDSTKTKKYFFTPSIPTCIEDLVSIEIEIISELDFQFKQFCENYQYFIQVNNIIDNVNIIDYEWKINGIPIINRSFELNIANHLSSLKENNIVEFKIVYESGCVITKTIEFLKNHLCKIQKGVSPNGDDLNDYFDLASFGGVRLKIFNRNGIKVYSNDNYKVEWYGQSNKGHKLPSGTYFYEIQTNKGEVFTGWIQLVN